MTRTRGIVIWQCVFAFAYSLHRERAIEKLEGNTLELRGDDVLGVLKALASPGRIEILRLLGQRRLNITEIAHATGQTQPTVTQSIKKLEQAGLIEATLRPVTQGHEKRCSRLYDNILIRLPGDGFHAEHDTVEVSMPVGRYRSFQVSPPCGLVTESEIIGLFDDPQSFADPTHVFAQLVWFAEGFIEYTFPSRVPPGNTATRLELSVEMCSEAPGYDPSHPSDITLWINGHEVGTWRCPGDFGGTRGRLTPRWWSTRYSQYGLLKHWAVTSLGSFLDGSPLSGTTVDRLAIRPGDPIRARFGIKSDVARKGGINLFGSKFGNYGQDIVLKLEFESDKE